VSKTSTSTLPRKGPATRRATEKVAAKTDPRSTEGGMDWAAFDALTDEEVIARALTDPDNLPMTEESRKHMKRLPRVMSLRRTMLRMTQEEFAETFQIPIGTLRDWEQGRTEPDQAAKAYLKVIAADPYLVRLALAHRPGDPPPIAYAESPPKRARKPLEKREWPKP
jgi:putative transcriptional regulator